MQQSEEKRNKMYLEGQLTSNNRRTRGKSCEGVGGGGGAATHEITFS